MTSLAADLKQYNRIRNQIAGNKATHAYLVSGAHRRDVAELIAQAAVCSSASVPCLECDHCKAVEHDRHVDVRWVEPDGSRLKLEAIRQIRRDIWLQPITSTKKVYVIVDTDRLTDEAANALLKVLEEPPEHGLLVLTTGNPLGVLATIRSRCQLLRVENEGCPQHKETEAAGELAGRVLAACQAGDLADLMITAGAVFDVREDVPLTDTIDALLGMLKDMLMTGEDTDTEVAQENAAVCMDYCSKALQLLDRNANPRLCLDALLIKIAGKLAAQGLKGGEHNSQSRWRPFSQSR